LCSTSKQLRVGLIECQTPVKVRLRQRTKAVAAAVAGALSASTEGRLGEPPIHWAQNAAPAIT
jgi:hypothetical protein